jgi:UDP-glucose 4-epimerase
LFSSGTQRRDFIAITDACRAIIHLSEVPFNKLENLIYNVGGNYNPTILEMAQRIKSRFESLFKTEIEIVAPKNTDDEAAPVFNYSTHLLIKTGFNFIANVDAEIDALLVFCYNNYNAQQ